MAHASSPSGKINLASANVLILEQSPQAQEILSQILRGFGVGAACHCLDREEAERMVRASEFDFIIVDPTFGGGQGFDFVSWLRRSKITPNCYLPVIVASGHAPASAVHKARNVGANFFITKPVTPTILLDRIRWILRDKREFVDLGDIYCGPDRRCKYEGPPPGSEGRRAADRGDLGQASEPNLSQDEINSFMKPQRVEL